MTPSTHAKPLVVFAHGKESGPWGTKFQHLAAIAERHGAQVLSPDYSDLSNPEQRVARLKGLPLPAHHGLVLVGSSMGGYVSCVASEHFKPAGLFLMAPAFGLPGYSTPQPTPHAAHTCVVMGWRDEVVPVEAVIQFAQAHRTVLHVLDADHRLNEVLKQLGEAFGAFLESSLGAISH